MQPIKVCMFPATNPKNEVIDTVVAGIRAQGGVEIFSYHYLFSFFRSFDVLHVHWPDAVLFPAPVWRTYMKSAMFLGFVVLVHALGRRIVWTVHNMESHEKRHGRLEELIWRVFLTRVDHVVHMCRQSEAVLRYDPRLAGASHALIPHPHYRNIYPNPPGRAAARERLNLPQDAFIFLFFGMIRPHKGVEELIDVFSAAQLQQALLVIAGEPIAFPQAPLAKAKKHPNIRLIERYLASNHLELLICASDVVVLPYLKILNSGVAVMALSLGRAILAPRSGAIVDLAEMLGARWVMCFDGRLKAEDLVFAQETQIGLAGDTNLQSRNWPDLSALAPESVGARMAEIFLKGTQRMQRR